MADQKDFYAALVAAATKTTPEIPGTIFKKDSPAAILNDSAYPKEDWTPYTVKQAVAVTEGKIRFHGVATGKRGGAWGIRFQDFTLPELEAILVAARKSLAPLPEIEEPAPMEFTAPEIEAKVA